MSTNPYLLFFTIKCYLLKLSMLVIFVFNKTFPQSIQLCCLSYFQFSNTFSAVLTILIFNATTNTYIYGRIVSCNTFAAKPESLLYAGEFGCGIVQLHGLHGILTHDPCSRMATPPSTTSTCNLNCVSQSEGLAALSGDGELLSPTNLRRTVIDQSPT